LEEFHDNLTVCGHAVCNVCLDKIMKCPMCRKVFKHEDGIMKDGIIYHTGYSSIEKVYISFCGAFVVCVIIVLYIIYS